MFLAMSSHIQLGLDHQNFFMPKPNESLFRVNKQAFGPLSWSYRLEDTFSLQPLKHLQPFALFTKTNLFRPSCSSRHLQYIQPLVQSPYTMDTPNFISCHSLQFVMKATSLFTIDIVFIMH